MKIRKGIPVSQGVAIGEAFLLDAEGVRIPQRFLKPRTEEVATREHQRFVEALAASKKEAQDRVEKFRREANLSAQVAGIFDFQVALHDDPDFLAFIENKIKEQYWSAEHAVTRYLQRQRKNFEKIAYFAERLSDLTEFEHGLLEHLVGEQREGLGHLTQPVIVIARDLTPTQTAELPRDKVLGFATDHGGKTSHTAIIAQNLGIPAVVGLGRITADVTGGEIVILDSFDGRVIIDPDEATLKRAREREQRFAKFSRSLDELKELPSETLDGHELRLFANIEFPKEIDDAIERGAQGIGLYRTEFLYDKENSDPSEEEHLEAYQEAVKRVRGRPLVIRTLDLGADKFTPEGMGVEPNPFLGCRSIRYCLREPAIFARQLRAILRASAEPGSDIRIMLPMISSLGELVQAKKLIQDEMEGLESKGVAFNPDLPIGIMIEVPSAALVADLLAQQSDFFSVGTNDLVQYALAVDRINEKVANLYQPTHPAIFRLLLRVIEAARRYRIPVSICGELSGEVDFTLPLIGLGLRDLSMAPASIPKIKRLIRSISAKDATRVADTVLTFHDASTAKSFLEKRAAAIVPELFQ
jgi:phosphotransferase system enzyme I (PtsI)